MWKGGRGEEEYGGLSGNIAVGPWVRELSMECQLLLAAAWTPILMFLGSWL